MIDPIVEEIRKYRQEHSERFGGDLRRICEDLRAYQERCGHKVVRFDEATRGEATESGERRA